MPQRIGCERGQGNALKGTHFYTQHPQSASPSSRVSASGFLSDAENTTLKPEDLLPDQEPLGLLMLTSGVWGPWVGGGTALRSSAEGA